MQCPYCESDSTRVLERHGAQRKRQCKGRGQRFATVGRINTEYLSVRKLDGSIERFRREKIIKNIGKTASMFRITAADVNAFIDRILDHLQPDDPEVANIVYRHWPLGTDVPSRLYVCHRRRSDQIRNGVLRQD